MKNYYEILGVSKESSPDEIKKAYRKLSLKYHPDKNPDGEERFKEISEAYTILSNPEKKSLYDNGGMNQQHGFGDINPMDLFRQFIGGNQNPFQRTTTSRRKKGRELRIKLKISPEESYFGMEKTLKYERIFNSLEIG